MITDKWEEHRLKTQAGSKAESKDSTSGNPDGDIEGNTLHLIRREVRQSGYFSDFL